MVEISNVYGSKEASTPLIIGVDTVYVHSNIRKAIPPKDIPEDRLYMYENMWEYKEIQYTRDEYNELMANILVDLQEMEVERQYNEVLKEWLE